jgi:hypothetical protein
MTLSRHAIRPQFDPRRIGGIQLWLDAADKSTVTLNGSTVSEWRDKSGKGTNYSQSTAAYQPGYSEAYKNGLNAVRMGASGTTWLNTGTSPSLSFKPATFFFVFQEETRGDFARVFNAPSASGADIYGAAGIVLSMHENGYPFRFTGNGFNAYSPAGDNSVAAGHTIATFIGASGKALARRNGTAGTQDNTNNTSGTPDKSYIGVYVDGGAVFVGNYYLRGAIYEIIGFDRELTSDEISSVETAMSRKWGISL